MTEQTAKPKPHRRWWQYSLRTFFVVLTVACVWLGRTVHRANEQRKAVEWVRQMRGYVVYGDAKPSGLMWLRDSLGADYFDLVLHVDLDNSQVNDLTPLARLTGLQQLWLNATQIRDLTPLVKLTSLQELALGEAPVRDLTPLATLTELKWLWLSDTQVSDLTPLAGLKSLEWLDLKNTQVNDLTPLAKLTSLQKLELENTPVSKEQVKTLQQTLPNCEIYWSPPDPSP